MSRPDPVEFRYLSPQGAQFPRVSARTNGFQVTWRLESGWLCRCKGTPPPGRPYCRHIRSVKLCLPQPVAEDMERALLSA